jgi:3-phytase
MTQQKFLHFFLLMIFVISCQSINAISIIPTPPAIIEVAATVSLHPPAEPSVTASLHRAEEEKRNVAVAQVMAVSETEPVLHAGDAADDIAIWIHPTNSALSTIIGTNKQGGFVVYDLTGKQLQYLPVGEVNNVDLRYDFPLGGEKVTLVTAGNRSNHTIAIYKVNPSTRQLENVAARTISAQVSQAYGACMYHSWLTDKYYFIVNSKAGEVAQWELFDNGQGLVDAKLARSFTLSSQTEGCVADDELGFLYLGEENVGIWKYNAEPELAEPPIQVDQTGPNGHMAVDIEGLTLYYASHGQGYLIASSQGNNQYVLYERGGNNNYAGTFEIIANRAEHIDAVSQTDGLDVTNFSLGNHFPQGLFVVQDGLNSDPTANQNFKLVPWSEIATAFESLLLVDTSRKPRGIAR